MSGFVLAAGCAAILYGCPYLFTTDAAVVAIVHRLAPFAMLSVVICSLAMVGDGIGIGTQAFAHLAPSSVLCCIIVYLALMGVVGPPLSAAFGVVQPPPLPLLTCRTAIALPMPAPS